MGCELAAYPSEREMTSNRISYLVDRLCSNKIFCQMGACFTAFYHPGSLLFLKFVVSAAALQFCIKPTRNTENSEDHRWKHTDFKPQLNSQMPITDQRTLSNTV